MKILSKNTLGLVMIGTCLFSLYLTIPVLTISPSFVEKFQFVITPLACALVFYLLYKEKRYAGIVGTIIFGILLILMLTNFSFNIICIVDIIALIASLCYTIAYYKSS